MRFILKIRLILVYILFLSSSLLLADVDKDRLEEIIKDTWKIKEDSLLKNWSQYEIEEYNSNTNSGIISRPRLEWNAEEQILTVSYYNRNSKNYIGKITIYLTKTLSQQDSYWDDSVFNNKDYQELNINGVKFKFNDTRDVEVYLGDLTNENIDKIEDRLRLAVISNAILNPWIRINNPRLKSDFKDNPEYGVYLSEPQDGMRRFLNEVFETVRTEYYNSKNNEEKNTELEDEELEEDVSFDKGVLIQLPTGMGKTRTVFSFLQDINSQESSKYRVLWFVSGTDILDKTTDDFNKHFSKDPMFSLQGSSNTEDNRDNLSNYRNLSVSLDLMRSTRKGSKKEGTNLDLIKEWIKSSSDPVIVVVDEAHRSAAKNYLKALEDLMNDKECSSKIIFTIGLTATPYREDMELSDLYQYSKFWGIGPEERTVKTGFDQIREAVSKGYIPIPMIIALNKEYLDDDNEKNSYDEDKLEHDFLHDVMGRLVRTNNKIIIYHSSGVNEAQESTARAKQAFKFLRDNIKKINPSNKNFEVFIASSNIQDSKDQINRFASSKYGILNLTNMGSHGTDIPDVDAILFLDASESRVKTLQRMGRAFRLFGGKTVTHIICWGGKEDIFNNLDKPIFYNSDPASIKYSLERIKAGIKLLSRLKVELESSEYETATSPLSLLDLLKEVSSSIDISYILKLLPSYNQEENTFNKYIVSLIAKLSNRKDNPNENSSIEEIKQEFKGLIEVIDNINKELVGTVLPKIIDTIFYFNITDESSLNMIKEIIFDYTFSWMKKNRRYLTYEDTGVSGIFTKISRRIKKIFGSFDEFKYEFIKKRIYKTEEEYRLANEVERKEIEELARMILISNFKYSWYEKNTEKNNMIQEMAIRFVIIPLMKELNRFPTAEDIQNSKIVKDICSIKIWGDKKQRGIFNGKFNLIRSTIEYIEKNIKEPERTEYLKIIYMSNKTLSLIPNEDKDEYEYILEKCRKNILNEISKDNPSLSDNYFFSRLYDGEKGKKFRKELQLIMIKKTMDFIKEKKEIPNKDVLLGMMGQFNKFSPVFYSKGTGRIGIFDNPSDRIRQTIEYIEENIEEPERTEYLEAIYTSKYIFSKIRDKEGEYEDILEKCRENILNKISENNLSLSDNYFFPQLYNGEKGKEFRKKMQIFALQKTIVFIKDKKELPSIPDLLGMICKFHQNSSVLCGGGSGSIGIFDSKEDRIKHTIEYIETDRKIKDSERKEYLDIIYRSNGILWKVGSKDKDKDKDKNEYILNKCRENILKKINEDNSSLSNEYFFSNLYKGVEGEKFRKKLQDIIIKKTFVFIKNHNKFPTRQELLKGIGEFSESGCQYILDGSSGNNGTIGIFDSQSDRIMQTLEYMKQKIKASETEEEKLKIEEYIDTIYRANIVLSQIQDEYRYEELLNECRKNILNKISKDKPSLSNEYFFSNLYKGVEGEKFRKELQLIMIKKTMDFIDSKEDGEKKMPTSEALLAGLGSFIKPRSVLEGAVGITGIFDGPSDRIIRTLEYIETDKSITEAKRKEYLEAIYTSNKNVRKMEVEDVLDKYRENILTEINKDNPSLSDNYFFSSLYKGVRGEKFRKELQLIMIKKTITFIETHKTFPIKKELLSEIGEFSNTGNSILEGASKDSIGIFDGMADFMVKILEYIEINYPESDESKIESRELYFRSLFFQCRPFGLLLIKIGKEDEDKTKIVKLAELILGSNDMQQIFIECRGEEAFNKIKKFMCIYRFSQDNHQ